ncbi:hypothetical protein BS47DRAFT_1310631 [Hydnum rufescens UP504]|uniref:Carbonic anhydrase n=1 Tax=Hydnum rufescens UP504 TaxID=1448309 RepID=A0A9P6ABA7_9AGAM|nr:hypothetical protein BS47DRAFT_1310631 [Hydnum rufescens UP504]
MRTPQILVLSCMDARIVPAQVLGIKDGDALVVRNAGGRAIDGLRSIVVAQQRLTTIDIRVLHHTRCGMLGPLATDDKMRGDLIKNPPKPNVSVDSIVQSVSFLGFDDVKQSVLDDVEFLKQHPLVFANSEISGWVYDIDAGGLAKRVV